VLGELYSAANDTKTANDSQMGRQMILRVDHKCGMAWTFSDRNVKEKYLNTKKKIQKQAPIGQ